MLIAVCFHRFGPYHVARLTAAAKRMNIVGVEFSASTNEYAWDPIESGKAFQRVVVIANGDIRDLPKLVQKQNIWCLLDDLSPDVVAINGWGTPDALAVFSWATKEQVAIVMMSDTTAWDFKRNTIKEWIKQRLLQQVQAGFVGGTAHVDYLVKLGIAASRVYKGYDVVDNTYFTQVSDRLRSTKRSSMVPHNSYFMVSSRFIPKKNISRLFDAFAKYRHITGGNGWELVVLGDGELRSELEKKRNYLQLESVIHMPGFIQYDNLSYFYTWASVYIQASTTEQWGLVVNEAMASGLPVLVSDHCGCATDLVENGRNGFTFDPYDVDMLTDLMVKISSDDCDRKAMGQASREIISHWTPETFANGLAKAVKVALDTPPPKASWVDKVLLWALGLR